MTLDEIRYLIDSFGEALRENASFLCGLYQIEVSLHSFPEIGYRVELFMNVAWDYRNPRASFDAQAKDLRKNMGSYPLDAYALKDFFSTAERVARAFDRNGWFLNWKKSIEREYKLRNIIKESKN